MIYNLCLDTGCIMSLINHVFFIKILLNCSITQYNQGIFIYDINNDIHNCKEYTEFNLYILIINGKLAKIY